MKKWYLFSMLLVYPLFGGIDYAQLRDPFELPAKQKDAIKKQTQIALEGIMYIQRKRCATLSCGGIREILELGASFKGYKLEKIGKDFVTLVRGKKQLKLSLE